MDPRVIVGHEPELSFPEFFAKHVGYARAAKQLFALDPSAPRLSFGDLIGMIGFLASWVPGPFQKAAAIPLALSIHLATVVGRLLGPRRPV